MRSSLFSLLPVFDRFFSRLVVFGNDDSSGNSSMLLHEEETLVSVLGSLGGADIVFGEAAIVNLSSLKIHVVNTVHICLINNLQSRF